MSEEAVSEYAREKHFSGPTVERWQRSPARDDLLELARRLRLGENQFRDVIDAVDDIATRHRCSPEAVFGIDSVAAVLNRGFGRSETLKALKLALHRLRFPQLAAAEARLRELVGKLGLPRGVRVDLPENLEGGHLSLTLRAQHAAELRSLLAACAEAADRDEVREIFGLLGGEIAP